MMPDVTVLMGVHNGEPYLEGALQSVLDQEFADFEVLIVDDASSDGTAAILKSAGDRDSRIRVLRNDANLGLTASLNKGLRHAHGRYIARMDADDLCLPQRLLRQVAALNGAPDLIAVACGHELVDGEGRTLSRVLGGLDDWQIRWLSGFNPPAPHPTYLFRRVWPDGTPVLYDEDYRTAQDFELWSRFLRQGRTRVLNEVLLKYRRHAGAITVKRRLEQAANCSRIGSANLRERLPPEIFRSLRPLICLFDYTAKADAQTIAAAVAGCDAMLAHDLPNAPTPGHRRWTRRMAAGLLADAILSRGGALRRPALLASFLYRARMYLPSLVAVVLSQPGTAIKSLRNTGKF